MNGPQGTIFKVDYTRVKQLAYSTPKDANLCDHGLNGWGTAFWYGKESKISGESTLILSYLDIIDERNRYPATLFADDELVTCFMIGGDDQFRFQLLSKQALKKGEAFKSAEE